jgi:hypothetical protein
VTLPKLTGGEQITQLGRFVSSVIVIVSPPFTEPLEGKIETISAALAAAVENASRKVKVRSSGLKRRGMEVLGFRSLRTPLMLTHHSCGLHRVRGLFTER